ncbi:hypothetical protein F5J12DRAFT_509521 [Pisolithus orientalis]|uniref:uncharacterized protein n=1 Tax=Pisolithus orientalis TaxID=936130 RepID=UPI002223F62A|nr:uncharacterized protein F5J12DRAFT_509521 [Pisolithus orientalis]KAI5988870.1 hypothetical protein F5J12DRAFT_509521 [Pisolithus orientalis]
MSPRLVAEMQTWGRVSLTFNFHWQFGVALVLLCSGYDVMWKLSTISFVSHSATSVRGCETLIYTSPTLHSERRKLRRHGLIFFAISHNRSMQSCLPCCD